MDIIFALNKYLGFLHDRKSSPYTTVRTYESLIKCFISVENIRKVSDISTETIDEYAGYLSLKNYSLKTFRNKLVAIRSFVKYLHSRDLIDLRPDQIDVPKNKDKESNFLTDDELSRFLRAINNPRDLALFFCMATSGMRVSEAANLQYSDIYGKKLFIRHGKGDKPRPVYITAQAKHALSRHLKSASIKEGYIFRNPDNQPLSRQLIARKTHYYAERAGIDKKVTPHTLRHTFCTLLANRNVDVAELRVMMGHASIRTTQTYIHFTDSHTESVYLQKMDFTV